LFIAAGILCVSAVCLAQEPPSASGDVSSSTSSAEAQPVAPPTADKIANAITDDRRMFKVLPNYKTVNDPSQPVTPIGAKQKFGLVLHYFDPFTYAFTGVQASIQQATNAQEGYGQGIAGYYKRYGADFTDALTNELFTVGVFPTLLREDPRYFRKGTGRGAGRTFYAISRVFVARRDSGRASYNFSEILGNLSSGALSNLYYPASERRAADIFSRTAFQMGYDAMFNVLKEFYPDLKRKFRHK